MPDSGPATVSVSRDIAASADVVWGLISDVTRMGEWSPETTGCEWRGDADHAVVAAKSSRVSGIRDRAKHNEGTMTESLERLAGAAEQPAS